MNTILVGMALLAQSPAPIQQPDQIVVRVNGKSVRFQAELPMVWYTRVLVPLKDVVQELGGVTRWNPRTTSLFVRVGERTARIKVGSQLGDVDGRDVWLDVAPRTVNGTTLVPLSFFEEAFEADARWNRQNALATINLTPRDRARTASLDDRNGRTRRAESSQRREYRAQVDGDAGAEYDRFLVEQDFQRYRSDRARWIRDYQDYRGGLMGDGSRGDFEPSKDYVQFLRQRDFETYANNQPGWRVTFNSFTRWRRTMNATERSPAFKEYSEARRNLVMQTERMLRESERAGARGETADGSGRETPLPPPP